MRKLQLFNVQIFCCFLFKLAQFMNARDLFYERKFGAKTANQSGKVHNNLQRILLLNMGLRPEDIETSEQYAEMSEKLPHFIPDFMKLFYDKYRFNLYNISVEIEGKQKYLGPVEMIHCQKLQNLHIWPTAGIHKLIFKPLTDWKNSYPLARELRVNKRLFPKVVHEYSNNKTKPYYMALMVFDDQFRLFKEKFINLNSFNKYGWISIDISKYLNSSVFYIKTYSFWMKDNPSHKRFVSKSQIKLTKKKYLYYANVVTFYKNESPMSSDKESIIDNSEKFNPTRNKRDLSQYSVGQEEDCQRHSLIVTFKEVGWSRWIIAPQNYNAYYCKGNCPYPLSDNFNATNHAIIQLLVHGMKDLSIPKPCCVPYHLHPETLLYLNSEGDALLREFKDMSVSSCSCR